MKLSREELLEWLGDGLTKRVLSDLSEERKLWLETDTLDMASCEATALREAYREGVIKGLDMVLNIGRDEE